MASALGFGSCGPGSSPRRGGVILDCKQPRSQGFSLLRGEGPGNEVGLQAVSLLQTIQGG